MLEKIENYIQTFIINDNNFNYYNIYQSLINKFYSDKDSSIYKINFVFYDKFKIEPSNFESTKILCEERIGQTKFRKDLIDFYGHCIVSGDDSEICQACHIIPFSETKFNHIDNGLLLNYNLHHLFDFFLFSFKFINSYNDDLDNYQIVLSNKIKSKNTFKNYFIYDNLFVKINKNSKYFLDDKYQQFIIANK
jgi:predicted restriction endonuclease